MSVCLFVSGKMVQNSSFINELYKNYFFQICAYCSALLDGDEAVALDCTHDVFETARESEKKLIHHPNIVGWLKKTANNRVKRALKKKGVRMSRELHVGSFSEQYLDRLQSHPTLEEQLSDIVDIDIESVKSEVLSCLTQDEFLLYRMRFQENLTYREISKTIEVPESTVRMRVMRVELKLRTRAAELI